MNVYAFMKISILHFTKHTSLSFKKKKKCCILSDAEYRSHVVLEYYLVIYMISGNVFSLNINISHTAAHNTLIASIAP